MLLLTAIVSGRVQHVGYKISGDRETNSRLDLEDCALARLSKRKVDPAKSTFDISPKMRLNPS